MDSSKLIQRFTELDGDAVGLREQFRTQSLDDWEDTALLDFIIEACRVAPKSLETHITMLGRDVDNAEVGRLAWAIYDLCVKDIRVIIDNNPDLVLSERLQNLKLSSKAD